MNQTLYYLCRHAVDIMDGWRPFPARLIAEETGVSLSTARRNLRKLKAEGYADTICENMMPDDEQPLPYHGWTITNKARETEEYKRAWEEEKQICRKVFGEHMFPEEE